MTTEEQIEVLTARWHEAPGDLHDQVLAHGYALEHHRATGTGIAICHPQVQFITGRPAADRFPAARCARKVEPKYVHGNV